MSRFKYSDGEEDIIKVLKMNYDNSTSLLNDSDIDVSRTTADKNIESSLAVLYSLGKNKEISKLSTEIAENNQNRKPENRAELETWEQIVAQANIHEPNPVDLEDIMSEIEIQDSSLELDKINRQFCKKTNIINKTDL